VAKEGVVVIGALLLGFGFLGHVVPIGELGSVTDLDNLCSSLLGQFGQALNEEARENCQAASILSKLAYAMIGIGVILIIIGAVVPSKKHSMFICGECDLAFSTEAELYNHRNTEKHNEIVRQKKESKDHEGEIKYLDVPGVPSNQKVKEISLKERLRKSPILHGVLIGIIVVVIFWGVYSQSISQTFIMIPVK